MIIEVQTLLSSRDLFQFFNESGGSVPVLLVPGDGTEPRLIRVPDLGDLLVKLAEYTDPDLAQAARLGARLTRGLRVHRVQVGAKHIFFFIGDRVLAVGRSCPASGPGLRVGEPVRDGETGLVYCFCSTA